MGKAAPKGGADKRTPPSLVRPPKGSCPKCEGRHDQGEATQCPNIKSKEMNDIPPKDSFCRFINGDVYKTADNPEGYCGGIGHASRHHVLCLTPEAAERNKAFLKARYAAGKAKGKGKKGKGKGRYVQKLDGEFEFVQEEEDWVWEDEGEEEDVNGMDKADFFLMCSGKNQVGNGVEEGSLTEMTCGECSEEPKEKPQFIDGPSFLEHQHSAVKASDQSPRFPAFNMMLRAWAMLAVICLSMTTYWYGGSMLMKTAWSGFLSILVWVLMKPSQPKSIHSPICVSETFESNYEYLVHLVKKAGRNVGVTAATVSLYFRKVSRIASVVLLALTILSVGIGYEISVNNQSADPAIKCGIPKPLVAEGLQRRS